MLKLSWLVLYLLIISFSPESTFSQHVDKTKESTTRIDEFHRLTPISSTVLQDLLNDTVEQTLIDFEPKGLKEDEIAVTLIDLGNTAILTTANFRGDSRIYPASIVKIFDMAALHRWLEDGKVVLTPELTRGLRDMITVSSNEATQYVLDVLTDTSSGSELLPQEFEKWAFKRNAVNRYYRLLGYKNINVNQKTFCDDAYGIEQQFRRYGGDNRNMLTTNAAASLMAEIVPGACRNSRPKQTNDGIIGKKLAKTYKQPRRERICFGCA